MIEDIIKITHLSKDELHSIGIDCGLNIPQKRMSWDEYFLAICKILSSRSIDNNTKFGCVFVKDNRIVVSGYNAFPENMPDNLLPNTRDEKKFKYLFINHAEEAAIYFAAKKGISLEGSIFYCLGHPCSSCCRRLLSVGVTDWRIGNKMYQMDRQEELLQRFWKKVGKVSCKNIDICV